jgi:hypothetical protein
MPSRADVLRALVALNEVTARLDEMQVQIEEIADRLDALARRTEETQFIPAAGAER